jgi:UDP-glucose 4-epimerase
MRILVTGGAGYVGSVSTEVLVAAGHEVTVLDSLATGHPAAVPQGAELVVDTLADEGLVGRLLEERRIEAVLHCAARSIVPESLREPSLYYRENVAGGISLLEQMREHGVDRLVFSSTAAVYGIPDRSPVDESMPAQPITPYGETKRAFEGALAWYGAGHGFRSVSLRYFNVAGASEARGEDHDPETHLIPILLRAYLDGPPLTIMGTDYPTPDGTAIRDFIHVVDLADAHAAALTLTGEQQPGLEICNLGSGSGFSVREVVRAAESVVGRPAPVVEGARRAGDPPELVASAARAAEVLGWHPARSSLEEMIGSAWRWHSAHPNGYEE